ncbi:hypothetical protein [Agrobacterium bohemicum]|uniref:Uncharacterized protein n=1 Tax=Agrobacterium bohemicum TaxID=2052828 RepID=A0A135P3Y7_9HYPH|nr:hypothetical protein [Agrobacterium bohemicum]KXG86137.1 hypothetical protein ATO67_05890 [Agrobacterium bohemicum]
MDKLLRNAIDSIEVGVEDFQSNEGRRALSAVRNVHAGVLLLCKTVLWQHSPDGEGSLIYIKMEPKKRADGKIEWQPNKNKTVDAFDIKARYKLLGLTLDWTKLEELTKHRNTIEHLYLTTPEAVVKEALANALPLINTIMRDQLKTNPEQEFRTECWTFLLNNADIFAEIEKECAATFEKLQWPESEVGFPIEHLSCTNCGSSLIRQQDPDNTTPIEIEFACRACGEDSLDLGEMMEPALASEAAGLAYIAMTDGGEPPIASCYECGQETYLIDVGQCVVCDASAPGECGVCGEAIHVNDYNESYPGLCGYHAHQAERAERD